MSGPTPQFTAARSLPAKPNLERLKNEAKRRLHGLRAKAPGAKLAEVQHHLAREYGFANWRDLKAGVETAASQTVASGPGPAFGDWIGLLPGNSRIAMHIRAADGDVAVTLDTFDYGFFGMPADDVVLEGDELSFTVITPMVEGVQQSAYQARWDAQTDSWRGDWTAHGIVTPVGFQRGAYAPAPRLEGLDGFWDGRLESDGRLIRLTCRFKSSPNGTFAWLDSLDTGVVGRPAQALAKEGRELTITMKTCVISGTLSHDGQWLEGHFLKGDIRRPLTMIRRPPGAAPPLPQRAPAIELAPEALAAFVGDYMTEVKTLIRVTLDEGRLHVEFAGPAAAPSAERTTVERVRGPKLELLASSRTKFFWRVLDATAEFELGADGRAVAMVTRQLGRRFRAMRVA